MTPHPWTRDEPASVIISDADMQVLLDHAEAGALVPAGPIRYQDSWWVCGNGSGRYVQLEPSNPRHADLIAELDKAAQQIAAANTDLGISS